MRHTPIGLLQYNIIIYLNKCKLFTFLHKIVVTKKRFANKYLI